MFCVWVTMCFRVIVRWVCTSGSQEDLQTTDALAQEVLETMMSEKGEYSVLLYCETIILCKI